MEFILQYPKYRESWYRLFVEYLKSVWRSKEFKNYSSNDLLID
jgi:hypothetical protein